MQVVVYQLAGLIVAAIDILAQVPALCAGLFHIRIPTTTEILKIML